jgi:ribose 5-phosphate isomerase A
MTRQDEEKRLVGERAALEVRDGMALGLGTGSTVRFFAEALGRRIRDEGLSLSAIPTSGQSLDLAETNGIPLTDWSQTESLDLVVDGADEVAPDLSLIKGGGGALLFEKIVASHAARRIYIADSAKLVSRLGAFPLPVEVSRFGYPATARHLAALGAEVTLRLKDGEPFCTDDGHLLYDCRFGEIADPAALERRIQGIPGVVDSGLFVGLVDLLIACRDGDVVLLEAGSPAWWA